MGVWVDVTARTMMGKWVKADNRRQEAYRLLLDHVAQSGLWAPA